MDDGDDARAPVDRHSFPYLRVRGNVALIGATSARATAPFMANGFFRAGQAHRLAALLQATGKRGPVPRRDDPPSAGAQRRAAAQAPVRHRQFPAGDPQRHGAELVLHGHSHLPSLHWIDGKKGKVPVVGVAAAGQAPGGRNPAAQYNLIDIDGRARRAGA